MTADEVGLVCFGLITPVCCGLMMLYAIGIFDKEFWK